MNQYLDNLTTELNTEICIVIPAYEPSDLLLDYISGVRNLFRFIIVINDGSSNDKKDIFENIKNNKEVILLEHRVNRGKGAALKTAFKYYQDNLSDKCKGVITVDADGQHSLEDVHSLSRHMISNQKNLLLGSRIFGEDVPLRSKFGNTLTSRIFKLLYRTNIRDTQTGLRGIPNKYIEEFINIKGDRYEYETNMLIYCIEHSIDICEVDIKTIYLDNNSSSHFNPIIDSLKIYKLFFIAFIKYCLSSFTSFLVDICLFKIFLFWAKFWGISHFIAVSTIAARICSSLINYILNRKYVFETDRSVFRTIIQYYLLVAFNMFLSAIVVTVLYDILGISEVIIKVIVDTCIFVISYNIQKKIVFKK